MQITTIYNSDPKKTVVEPQVNLPISTSEKLVHEDIRKLSENTSEIQRLKEVLKIGGNK